MHPNGNEQAERAELAEAEAEESADQGMWEQQRRTSEARIAIAAAQVKKIVGVSFSASALSAAISIIPLSTNVSLQLPPATLYAANADELHSHFGQRMKDIEAHCIESCRKVICLLSI